MLDRLALHPKDKRKREDGETVGCLIEQAFEVDAPIERVWSFIRDPEAVGPCLPGCQGIEVTGDNTYKSTIKVGIGPIKTSFVVDVELIEEEPPHLAKTTTRGEEGGRASSVTAESELRLRDLGNGATEVAYSSDVNVVGRLAKFGFGIMKKKAQSMGVEFSEAVKANLEGE